MKRAISYSFQIFTLISILLVLPGLLAGQSFRGSIRGLVTDPSGAVVPNAKVTVKGTSNGIAREAVSGPDGVYIASELPAASYEVSVEFAGFVKAVQTAVVAVGRDTTVDFKLTLHGGETVTVSAPPPLVDTAQDVLGEVVEQRLVTELPLNGRDFGKLVALTPGTTVDPSGVAGNQAGFGQFNINGNRDRSNNYTLDGTDNNDPFLNNSALNQVGIGGAPASLLPIDAIQEFNLQSGFGAEYGRNSGSVVNIITKSGTNQVHGSGFGFLRNSALDARNYFNTESHKSVFQNSNFGGSVGGPVVKAKTYFFGAYEGERERVGSDFLLLVPTQNQIQEAETAALSAVNPNTEQPYLTSINPGLLRILSFYPQSTTGQIADAVARQKRR